MDTLLLWWRANAVALVIGSLAWTGVAAIVLRFVGAPILRQRLAETAVAGCVLWFALGFVPGRSGAMVVVENGASSLVATTTAGQAAQPTFGDSLWAGVIDAAGLVFGVGVLLASCHLLAAALLLRRIVRRAVPAPAAVRSLLATLPPRARHVPVVVSQLVWRPFCCGLMRPHIVLPQAMLDLTALASSPHLRAVLLHELAHAVRGDLRGRCLFALAMPLQFWNPLFWMLRRTARDAAELLADDVAVTHYCDRVGYARSLIDLAELLPAAREGRVAALGVFGPEVHFSERMTMLLRRQVPLTTRCSRTQTVLRSAAGVSLAFVAAACWTGVRADVPPHSTAHGNPPSTYFAYDDTEITAVIDTIAKIAGANIVVAPDVTGRVSLHTKNVPWREALDAAVRQVGAHVTELDGGILEVSR